MRNIGNHAAAVDGDGAFVGTDTQVARHLAGDVIPRENTIEVQSKLNTTRRSERSEGTGRASLLDSACKSVVSGVLNILIDERILIIDLRYRGGHNLDGFI